MNGSRALPSIVPSVTDSSDAQQPIYRRKILRTAGGAVAEYIELQVVGEEQVGRWRRALELLHGDSPEEPSLVKHAA